MKNLLKQKLLENKVVYGPWIMTSGLDNAEILAHAGADLIMIDGEHGSMDLETAGRMVSLIRQTPTAPLLRVAWNEMSLIKRGLDTGAAGIMVPMINTKAEAEQAVYFCKYPPAGFRGMGASRAVLFGSGAEDFADYYATANSEVLVILQIEHYTAVENVEEIASVPGIDILFVGPGDLSMSMGLPGQMDHPDVQASCKKVVEACRRHKVIPAMLTWAGGMRKHIDMGFRVLIGGIDSALLLNGAKQLVNEFRNVGQ